MTMRQIPVAYIQSKDILLRLKKAGSYSIKSTKPVSIKDINKAIDYDEALINEFKSKIDEEKISLLDELESKYLQVKDSEEWKSLCNAHKKIYEYNKLFKTWGKEDCYDEGAYIEIKNILTTYYLRKYQRIVNNNIYKDLYEQREALRYSQDAYYMTYIKNIKESIDLLKEYCREHQSEIKGYKKIKHI